MKKLILLLLFGTSLILSFESYVLSKQIDNGTIALAEGKKQLAIGEIALVKGKIKLAGGEKELSEAKEVNSLVQDAPLMSIADKTPIAGNILTTPGKEIATGNRERGKGIQRLIHGEQRLAQGELQLKQGTNKLNQAKIIQVICGWAAVISGVLFLMLFFYWRKSLYRRQY